MFHTEKNKMISTKLGVNLSKKNKFTNNSIFFMKKGIDFTKNRCIFAVQSKNLGVEMVSTARLMGL